MKKKISIILLVALMVVTIAGCSQTASSNDAGDKSIKALSAIVKANKDKRDYHGSMKLWVLSLTGDDGFEWTKDTSNNKSDLIMSINADEFIAAGVDPSLLGEEWSFSEGKVVDEVKRPDKFSYKVNVSDKRSAAQGYEDAFRRVLRQYDGKVLYNETSQYYRLPLGQGFELQWTEKLGNNEADMALIIPADPLINAGLDLSQLEDSEWTFKEEGAEPTDTDANPNQLVKTYNLNAGGK